MIDQNLQIDVPYQKKKCMSNRYSNWLSSGLRAWSTGNANANPGSEWAISAALEDFIYVCFTFSST